MTEKPLTPEQRDSLEKVNKIEILIVTSCCYIVPY